MAAGTCIVSSAFQRELQERLLAEARAAAAEQLRQRRASPAAASTSSSQPGKPLERRASGTRSLPECQLNRGSPHRRVSLQSVCSLSQIWFCQKCQHERGCCVLLLHDACPSDPSLAWITFRRGGPYCSGPDSQSSRGEIAHWQLLDTGNISVAGINLNVQVIGMARRAHPWLGCKSCALCRTGRQGRVREGSCARRCGRQ